METDSAQRNHNTMTPLSPPATVYKVAPSLHPTPYTLPIKTYLVTNPPITNLLASAAVFHHETSNNLKLLLIQRSPSDFLPLFWELPGGGAESDTDTNLLATAVRELHEETGLVATKVVRYIAQKEFPDGPGKRWRALMFEVEAELEGEEPAVKLDPAEHVASLWVTEEDIRRERCGDVELKFVEGDWKGILLGAFEGHREGCRECCRF